MPVEKKEVKKEEVKEVKSAIDQLLDPNDNENVVLYDGGGKGYEFEQIALVPFEDGLYSILKPVLKYEGIADDEAVLFVILEEEDGVFYLDEENDERIKEEVFKIYTEMWNDVKDQNEGDENK